MTRSELYALVWRLPVRRLAPLLGMSDHGLSKLCRRHDIPAPGRGYWARIAAGQLLAVPALPPRPLDETIPRFRSLDANGMPDPGWAQPERWIIPGVLLAAPLPEPTADGEGIRAALAETARPAARQMPMKPPRRRSKVTARPSPVASPRPVAHPPIGGPSGIPDPEPPHPVPQRRGSPHLAQPDRASDLEAQLQIVFTAAAEQQRRHGAMQILAAIALRAADEEPDMARRVLAWAAKVRKTLEADDPVEHVLISLRAEASGARGRRGVVDS